MNDNEYYDAAERAIESYYDGVYRDYFAEPENAYTRTLDGIRRKAEMAAQLWDQQSMVTCPYKRGDFIRVWKFSFEAEAGVNLDGVPPREWMADDDLPF